MTENRIVLVGDSKIGAELQKLKPQIEAALPRHITPDRMARIALTQLRKTPKLYSCTLQSFFGSIITASQLGLEPGVNGQCYLIPYGQECTFIPGWRGYMDLLSRSGRANAWTGAVYDGDEFDYEYGSKPFILHKPGKWSGDKNALIFAYAVGRINGMDWPTLEVWDIDRIWAQRDRNNKCKTKTDHYSYTYPEMYARKLPLLQVIKYLPSSIEINTASELDVSGSEGRQHITIEGAFNKTFDGGDSVEKDLEIEQLMNKLNWDEQKRETARDEYSGRSDALLSYLKQQAAPLESNGKAAASQAEGNPTARRGKKAAAQAPETKTDEPKREANAPKPIDTSQPNLRF
jgi:recombination protein RecT